MALNDRERIESEIKAEKERLTKIYAGIETKRKQTIEGLIQRAAFMRVSLQDLEDDLNLFGFTEFFSQGEQEPYLRKRPTADLYNTMNASYQKIIKQLTDLLPEAKTPAPKGDGFEDFVNGRED